jgi:hypothetical protein
LISVEGRATTTSNADVQVALEAGSDAIVVLAAPEIVQEQHSWCWAAASDIMFSSFYGLQSAVPQCVQASAEFGQKCCGSSVPSACDQPAWPEFSRYGFSVTSQKGCWPSWDRVNLEVRSQRRPFGFVEYYDQQVSHMQVVTGLADLGANRFVKVFDPFTDLKPGEIGYGGTYTWRDYDYYRGKAASFEVAVSYYSLKKSGDPKSIQNPERCDSVDIASSLPVPPSGSGDPSLPLLPGTGGASANESLRLGASRGLEIIKLIGVTDPGSVGFGSAADTAFAVLDHGQDAFAAVEQLNRQGILHWKPKGRLEVIDTQTTKQLVYVGLEARAFIELASDKSGGWRPTKLGETLLARRVAQARTAVRNTLPSPATSVSLLFVPAVEMYFLKLRSAQQVTYSPVRNVGGLIVGGLYTEGQLVAALRTWLADKIPAL